MSAAESEPRTDWQAVFLWALIPLTVAAGFVYAGLTSDWGSHDWLPGLLALLPFEFVRALVLSILSETYREYRTPAQAVRAFLVSLAILIVISVLLCLYVLGFRDFFDAIRQPEIYRAVGVAIAVIAADGVIGVYFFRGDARRLSARLQAAADDARDWLLLGGIQLPVLLALAYGVLLLIRESRGALPWVPDPASDAVRSLCLFYAAFYFVGKAAFLAHANLARFDRSGRRLLGAEWVQRLIWKKSEDRASEARSELASERKRRAVLMGERDSAADGS